MILKKKRSVISELEISNSAHRIRELVLEPWGESIDVEKYGIIRLVLFGPIESCKIEIEHEVDSLTLAFGRAVTVEVEVDGEKMPTASAVFPTLSF